MAPVEVHGYSQVWKCTGYEFGVRVLSLQLATAALMRAVGGLAPSAIITSVMAMPTIADGDW